MSANALKAAEPTLDWLVRKECRAVTRVCWAHHDNRNTVNSVLRFIAPAPETESSLPSVAAPEGFALAGFRAHLSAAGERQLEIYSLQLVFARQNGNRLDMKQLRESAWIGNEPSEAALMIPLISDGTPVCGLAVRCTANVEWLGLVFGEPVAAP
jgi:hypothetical protein